MQPKFPVSLKSRQETAITYYNPNIQPTLKENKKDDLEHPFFLMERLS